MCDRKPNCSYNCLIGMALKSSESGRLPVGEIYRFFEREFPYFLTAAEPWKNSLRHSLSLGHYFRKYNSDKLVTKKGHLWEVDPQRASELDKEMYMFLARGMPENIPASPQLSRLRLQMTQLLLDSIKTSPSSGGCHGAPHCHMALQQPILSAAISYTTPPKPAVAAMYNTPQKRPAGSGSLIHTPTASPLLQSELTPRKSVLCQAAPTAMLSPNFPQGQHRPATVGCFLASTPIGRSSKQQQQQQAMVSPQLPHTPRTTATGGGTTIIKKLIPSGCNGMQMKRTSHLSGHLQSPRTPTNASNSLLSPRSACSSMMQSPSPRTPAGNGMCSEAFQLMQFCNHCSINNSGSAGGGIDASKGGERRMRELTAASPIYRSPAAVTPLQREDSLSEQSQLNTSTTAASSQDKLPLDPNLAELLHNNSQHQHQVEDTQCSTYYPFLAPPTGHRNVSLSQLNSNGNYQLEPGQPKELNITKTNPKSRGDATKQHMNFESAVRPVVYDWNGWWEAEHVLCMMNEESYINYIECKSEENIKKILEKKKSHSESNRAMLTTTMTPDRWQRRSCSHFRFRRGGGQNWVRRLKARKALSPPTPPSPSPPSPLSPPLPPPPPPPSPPRERLGRKAANKRYCVELPSSKVNRNLELIVSIPFRQLVTDRQMKKYCVAGAKHRIPTEYME